MTYRCDHILGDIEHWHEDYYIMLTTADGKQGRLSTGSVEKMKQWIRRFEGSVAYIFIRTRTTDGYVPKMQGVWSCKKGQCRNLTCHICGDHVDYDDCNKTVGIEVFDGQHQRRNTEAWL